MGPHADPETTLTNCLQQPWFQITSQSWARGPGPQRELGAHNHDTSFYGDMHSSALPQPPSSLRIRSVAPLAHQGVQGS